MIKQVIRNIISYFVTLTNVKKLKKRESPPCDDIHEQRGDSFNQSGEHSPKPAEIMSHVPAAMWATPSMRNKRVKKQATMKTWIAGDSHLAALYEGIQKYTGFNTTGLVNHETRSTQINLSDVKINAVKKIQHAWRGYKVKELFVNDPYGSYVSMIHPDDEQRLLSSIMFGRHEAEFGINAKDRIANPYIEGSASYHRCDKFSGKLLEQLKIEFKITNKMLEGKIILPLTKLNTVSMDDLIKQSGARGVKVISDPNHSISFVLFDSPNENLRWFFVSSGLIASPWEIAQNVTGLANSNDAAEASLSNDTAYMRGLPKTKDELLQSDLFLKLERIAQRKDCPTHPLASSLVQLLNNDDVLTSAAITRIALIIDMANTFYAKNYPRYAFCVYTIIHELSLSIALQDDPAQLDMGFKRFINESKDTLFNSLGLDETQLGKSTFIASPALSGTNAYMIAKRIASVMASKSGKNPTIATYGPRYFELKSQEFEYPWFSDPDIVLISTGPIVNMGGLTPGVDLNGFIRDKMIKQGRTKPLTLIVDTTTALYKSLHLDEDVKKLVTDGKLSIIVCESHQKFGLLHSDQAQYGRVFGVCATDSDRSKISKLQQIQTDAQLDFNQHMDMRVGANISYCCKDILEKIKQQHFSNGALFNNILNQANLISHHIVNHKYMSKKLDELYFVMPACSWQDFAGVVTTRASFGHYSTTLSFVGSLARLCANASDDIDSLITSSQIYLALTSRNQRKRNKGIEEVVKKNSTNMKELVQAEQVISLALTLNMINSTLYTQPERFIEQIERYCVLKNVLSACESLKGRHSYNDVSQYFYSLKKQIIAKIKIMGGNAATFLKVAQILHNHNVPLSDEILPILSLNGITCRYILRMSDSILLNNDSIHDLTHNPDAVANILNHTNFLDDHAELFKVLRSSGIYFDVKTLEALLTNQPTLVALSQLLNHKISLDSDTIKMLGKPEFVEFISSNTPLTQEMFNALAMLNSADLNIDEMTRDVTNKNDRFFELMSLVYNGNAGVLTHLKEKDGGYKYHQALRYTPIYLKECSLAIKAFCAKSPSLKNNNRLIRSINQANEKYCSKVLSLERGDFVSSIAKAMFNNILVGLIAILTLGIAAAVLPISKYRFFTTTSEKKLTNIEAELGHSLAKNTPKNGRM